MEIHVAVGIRSVGINPKVVIIVCIYGITCTGTDLSSFSWAEFYCLGFIITCSRTNVPLWKEVIYYFMSVATAYMEVKILNCNC